MGLRRSFTLFAATLLVIATCKKDGSGPPTPTNIVINTSAVTLASINQTVQLSAVVLDQNGAAMTGQTMTWQSAPSTVASVTGTGLVTALANGSAQVTAHVGSLSSAATAVTVAQAATTLSKVSGDAQTDTVGQTLGTALTVQANDALGSPVAGVTVNFTTTSGNLSAPSGVTAANGRTSVTWTLGTVSGAQSVGAAAAGATGATFAATALADAPTQVVVQAGDGQTGPVGLAVSVDPSVRVRDQYNNGVPGRTVTFVVTAGGGSLTSPAPVTNAGGIAAVGSWTLGSAGSNTLDATVGGGGSITGNPVTFTATGVAPGSPASIAVSSGNGQTGLVGYAVNVPPAVIVRDSAGGPVPNVEVTFATGGGSGSIIGPLVDTTGPSGIASVAGWQIGAAPGANTLTATATPGGLTGNPVTFTATGQTAQYNIEVRFVTAVSPAQQAAFDSAEARWERLIFGDLPNITLNTQANDCQLGEPALNETVDDIVIFARLDSIDGPLNVLGRAGPCFIRTSGFLTIVGVMHFDTADVAMLIGNGQFDETVMHEMGHVLGFGTLWGAAYTGLLADPVSGGGTDPHFIGAQAIAAFDRSGGQGYSGGQKVPVENTGGAGTRDGHWRESVFDTELLTGFLDASVANPYSVITTASMEDLGYVVNYAASEAYTVANPLALRAQAVRTKIPFGDDILRIPVRVVDRAGRVIKVIQSQ